jgi:hypothetical protein
MVCRIRKDAKRCGRLGTAHSVDTIPVVVAAGVTVVAFMHGGGSIGSVAAVDAVVAIPIGTTANGDCIRIRSDDDDRHRNDVR